jgi:hypothetical protein
MTSLCTSAQRREICPLTNGKEVEYDKETITDKAR